LEAGVQRGPNDHGIVVVLEPVDERRTRAPKRPENVPEWRDVVIRVVRATVVEVGHRQPFRAALEITEALGPQGFEIQQMPGVFLDGPALADACGQRRRLNVPQTLLEPSRRATNVRENQRVRSVIR
jgi:hypothetical protein